MGFGVAKRVLVMTMELIVNVEQVSITHEGIELLHSSSDVLTGE